jgi:protein involved in polysaccharide export with SLBB domain
MKKTSFFIIACAIATSIFITGCSIFSKPVSKMIIIQGEVNRPGEYIVKKPIKFILLLFKAYGYTENAAPKNAVVERNGKSSIINLSIPANEPPPHLAETFTVYPGDIITIPRIKTLKKIQTKQ